MGALAPNGPIPWGHDKSDDPRAFRRRSTIPALTEVVRELLEYPIVEVQAQCWGTESTLLIETGRALAAIDPRVVVKVPVTLHGVRAVSTLHRFGIRTTLTAVYAAHQVLTAAAAGSDYVAPYYGRIGDSGREALAVLTTMQQILATSGRQTRLLVASIRTADDLAVLAAAGMNTFTFGPKIAEEMFGDPLTSEAAAAFEKAAQL